MQQFDNDSGERDAQSSRRENDRRRTEERRGALRWDPQKKERRAGKDRRKTIFGQRRGR